MEFSQAYAFCILREVWLKLQYSGFESSISFEHCAPISVPEPYSGGDSGEVLFADGSSIRYDWDNGTFECSAYFTYPLHHSDILFTFERASDEVIANAYTKMYQ